MPQTLEIRLLGELEVRIAGKALALPPSKKTRALLGYLVATGCEQRREKLCELLWEHPDDPRGALRWSLSKIRPLLDSARAKRLATDRERVRFDAQDTAIDVVEFRALADDASAAIGDLERALEIYRGEFLDGLEL